MALDPALAALALGDDAVFLGELAGGIGEGLLGLEQAGAAFAAQTEIPIFGDLLGAGDALFAGARAVFLIVEVRRALPIAASGAFIELDAIA